MNVVSAVMGVSLIVAGWLLSRKGRQALLAAEGVEPREREFARRQLRRREWTNRLLIVIGTAVIVGIWVTVPWAILMYWSGVALVVICVALLACWDAFATQSYYRDIRAEQLAERKALEAEVRRLRALRTREGNGSHRGQHGEDRE